MPQLGESGAEGTIGRWLKQPGDTVTLGTESTYYWSVGAEWQRVEGTWTFELWYRDRQLLKQNFDVVRE